MHGDCIFIICICTEGCARAQTAGIISGMETVYGIIFAFVFLREVPTVRELIGGAVILGVALYSSLKADD